MSDRGAFFNGTILKRMKEMLINKKPVVYGIGKRKSLLETYPLHP